MNLTLSITSANVAQKSRPEKPEKARNERETGVGVSRNPAIYQHNHLDSQSDQTCHARCKRSHIDRTREASTKLSKKKSPAKSELR
ncbi:hypothetical protein K0M31_018391 [Melipona bicolor]|uniref:Uncharacterized protein n=1 Tax=Melipona bicolor TaxID=60889 RepID=A0AA40KRW0_9HYME|nr:hypothetical protein K0M31_018391 [Melipona bicolor]